MFNSIVLLFIVIKFRLPTWCFILATMSVMLDMSSFLDGLIKGFGGKRKNEQR